MDLHFYIFLQHNDKKHAGHFVIFYYLYMYRLLRIIWLFILFTTKFLLKPNSLCNLSILFQTKYYLLLKQGFLYNYKWFIRENDFSIDTFKILHLILFINADINHCFLKRFFFIRVQSKYSLQNPSIVTETWISSGRLSNSSVLCRLAYRRGA